MIEKLETLAIVARCFCLINIILTDELFDGVGLKKAFDLMLYAHDKQLRSCWDASYSVNHTVPGQSSRKQFTSIK